MALSGLWSKRQRSSKPLTKSKDYEKVGRSLERMFEGGYLNHWRVYRINFVRGIFFGLGTFLGGTVMVAILIWLMSFFDTLPVIDGFVETIRESIN